MDYLRFDCLDMRLRCEELRETQQRLRSLSAQIEEIWASTDPQLRAANDLQAEAASAAAAIGGLAVRLAKLSTALELISETYHIADSKISETVAGLPVGLAIASAIGVAGTTSVPHGLSVSEAATIRDNLAVEDWLLELVYRSASQPGRDNPHKSRR